MTKPIDVRTLSAEDYARAEREFLAHGGMPPTAPAAPVNLADKPDSQCIDVRNLSPEEFERRLAKFLSENGE